MAEDERRGERAASRRRDSSRPQRLEPPIIDAEANKPADDPAVLSPVEELPHAEMTAPTPSPADVDEVTAGSDPVEPVVTDRQTGESHPESLDPPPEQPMSMAGGAQNREPKRPSIVPALAALVVAILAAGWIYLYNQISSVQTDGRAQLADLQSKVAELEARPAPDTTALTKRVDGAATQESVQALSQRLDALQSSSGADPKQIQGLQTEVVGVKNSVGALQATVAALPKPDLSRVDRDIGGLGQKLNALQTTVAAIPHVDLGPLTGKVDGLAGKVDGVEARLKPLEAEAEAARSPQRVAERRAAPVAVTAQAIVEAITAGQAFPHEFAALQALGADPVKLAPLQTVAGSGAPSLRDLQANLAELRDKIVAEGAPKPSGSYMDRLMAGAGSLVQVRPLGSVVGDTPAAIVARMNDAIGADELARALHEWGALPEQSRTVSNGLADRMRVRLEAEEAAKGIAANAIGAMAAPRG